MSEAVRIWTEREGAVLRLRLSRPKANILDGAMISALRSALADNRHVPPAGVLLDAEGTSFCYGAAVEEHTADKCAAMLSALHGLVIELLTYPAPVMVAVRGQCLGGGLELAMACGRVFASPDARFGQPEIKLGVFAPAASVLLPLRVKPTVAEDLLLTGRTLTANEALAVGLVQSVSDDPEQTALGYLTEHFAGRSRTSMALALRAARAGWLPGVRAMLKEVEALYLGDLMNTYDANEGIAAFMARRAPAWAHR